MFATLLLEQGVSLEKISGALGHSSIQTTYEYYCDVIEEEEKVIRFVNEKNRSRRKKTFRDWDYICCSTLGNPRSKTFHSHHFKKLLNQLHLPNIRFHELRTTYSTMLLKQDFTSKAISKLLGHSNFTLAADIYGDKTELTEDCLKALKPVIEELVPKKQENLNSFYDYSGLEEMIHLPELFL